MEKFFESYNLPRLHHSKTSENLNQLTMTKEIKPVIENLPVKKAQNQMSSQRIPTIF